MEHLTDTEKSKIMAFNADPILVEAIRKVMLASIYSNGTLKKGYDSDPLKNGALTLAFVALQGRGTVSNEDLGADLRGLAQGVMLLETGFNELSKIKDETEVEELTENIAI